MKDYFGRCFIGAYFSALGFLLALAFKSIIFQIVTAICFFGFIIFMTVKIIIECETTQNLNKTNNSQ